MVIVLWKGLLVIIKSIQLGLLKLLKDVLYLAIDKLWQLRKYATVTLIGLGFCRVVFSGGAGGAGGVNLILSLHISKRTYLISVYLYKNVKESI